VVSAEKRKKGGEKTKGDVGSSILSELKKAKSNEERDREVPTGWERKKKKPGNDRKIDSLREESLQYANQGRLREKIAGASRDSLKSLNLSDERRAHQQANGGGAAPLGHTRQKRGDRAKRRRGGGLGGGGLVTKGDRVHPRGE